MTAFRRLFLIAAVLGGLTSAACSAEGGVDSDGDGIQIEGDVDEK